LFVKQVWWEGGLLSAQSCENVLALQDGFRSWAGKEYIQINLASCIAPVVQSGRSSPLIRFLGND